MTTAATAATAVEIPAPVARPAETATTGRRGRRSTQDNEQERTQVLFFLAEKTSDDKRLVLGQKFDTEGLAMVEALRREVPFYRVEVWKSRVIVKDGAVEIKKEPVPPEHAEHRADGFRTTNR